MSAVEGALFTFVQASVSGAVRAQCAHTELATSQITMVTSIAIRTAMELYLLHMPSPATPPISRATRRRQRKRESELFDADVASQALISSSDHSVASLHTPVAFPASLGMLRVVC